jgi:hypothetical protein
MTTPKPTVVTAYATTVAMGPKRGCIVRAAATAATASEGVIAPTDARSAMSSIRPARSSWIVDRLDTSTS